MNMTPIRQSIFVLTQTPTEPAEMTLRQAVEWFKTAVRGVPPGELSGMERKELDGTWAAIAAAIAKREGVPDGSLSYFLGELAQTEIRLANTVADEAHAAGIDYVKE